MRAILKGEEEEKMVRGKIWFSSIIFVTAISFIASGCAKKQTVKEGAAPTPAVVTQKEVPKTEVPKEVQKPAEEAAKPATPAQESKEPTEQSFKEAKVEAKPKEAARPTAIDLAALRIQFAFDDHSLSSQSRENLAKIAAWLKDNPSTKIQIQGNTCDLGTEEYNLALGEKRADSAQKYLVGLGVDSSRLSKISYGEERPMVPNTDETNRSLNRRDDFVVTK